ncbi:hypothetical protein CROQUDRAFT_42959 [Cronartium quercuum f. sp. fusiforme G11]|uniref:VHS domain-containing protein n=1 Tax=Cronartium quercuum f. sp. fusiforme G11 TaxID=708437 RepID=A0A9P6NKR8_9BASI|nr:hypothetical protein CROQUDRAFT_42959 [Cronartium quercuum f. sp. fusiforme G11]
MLSEKKKPRFLARFQSKNPTKQPHHPATNAQGSSEIERCITWFCAHDEHTEDWVHILEFCDRLSTSEVGCKEAVHALRKELKHGSPSVQVRAIRLTVILVLNSSDRLRLQIASKKFLDTVEEVFHKAAKDPQHNQQVVCDMISKAFSVLGYEFQRDRDLQVFTQLYNKIKPPDGPMGGAPLDEDDLTFTPGSARSVRVPAPPIAVQTPLPEPVRDLRAEAEVARANARLLIEALAYTNPAEMDSNELIQEFHSKCLQNQNQLLDDIPWATAQAEQARLHASSTPTLPNTNPFAPLVNGAVRDVCKEEELLATLLAAHSDLIDAFRQYDEMDRLARSERELREAEARSKVDTRAQLGHSLPTDMGASSSCVAKLAIPHAPASLPLASRNPFNESITPTEGYVVEDGPEPERILGSTEPFSSTQPEDWLGSEEPLVDEPEAIEVSTSSFVRSDSRVGRNTEDSISIPDRSEPSEKALGKMRRISGLQPDNGVLNTEEQAELEKRREEVETKFRERYRLYHQQQAQDDH